MQQLKNSPHNPETIALQDDNQSISYQKLFYEINIRAKKLINVTTLGIAMDNCVEWVLWDLAAIRDCRLDCVSVYH